MENIDNPETVSTPTPTEKSALENASKRLLEIISQHTGIGRRGKIVPRTNIIREMADRIRAREDARNAKLARECRDDATLVRYSLSARSACGQ